MAKWVKNDSGSTKTWVGQQLDDQAYYEIQSVEETQWSSDSTLLTDIASGDAIVAKDDSGSFDISDVNEAIDYLKGNISPDVKISSAPAFADKAQLFFRGRGVKATCTANSTTEIKYTIPYAKAKINGMEIMYGQNGDTCNFKVLDTTTGTYTTIPNYLLNQFGFDWNITDSSLKEILPYDANLLLNMQVVVEYTNNGNSDVDVGVNFYIHEDKS